MSEKGSNLSESMAITVIYGIANPRPSSIYSFQMKTNFFLPKKTTFFEFINNMEEKINIYHLAQNAFFSYIKNGVIEYGAPLAISF